MNRKQKIEEYLRRALQAVGCGSYYQWLEGLHPHTHGGPGVCFACESVVHGDSFLEQVPFNELGWICASCGAEEVMGISALHYESR